MASCVPLMAPSLLQGDDGTGTQYVDEYNIKQHGAQTFLANIK